MFATGKLTEALREVFRTARTDELFAQGIEAAMLDFVHSADIKTMDTGQVFSVRDEQQPDGTVVPVPDHLVGTYSGTSDGKQVFEFDCSIAADLLASWPMFKVVKHGSGYTFSDPDFSPLSDGSHLFSKHFSQIVGDSTHSGTVKPITSNGLIVIPGDPDPSIYPGRVTGDGWYDAGYSLYGIMYSPLLSVLTSMEGYPSSSDYEPIVQVIVASLNTYLGSFTGSVSYTALNEIEDYRYFIKLSGSGKAI